MNTTKKSKVILFLCIGSGAAVAVASLIGLIFAPVVLEIEIALAATGSTMAKASIPSIILIFEGMNRIID